MRNAKGQFLSNWAFWRLDLATRTSCEFEFRANYLARLEVLSCSAPVVMTLQLLRMLGMCATSGDLQAVSYPQEPVASPCYFA